LCREDESMWINDHAVIYAMILEMNTKYTTIYTTEEMNPMGDMRLFTKQESKIEYVIIFWNI